MPKLFSKSNSVENTEYAELVTKHEELVAKYDELSKMHGGAQALQDTLKAEVEKLQNVVSTFERKEKIQTQAQKLGVEFTESFPLMDAVNMNYTECLEKMVELSVEQKGQRLITLKSTLNPSVGDTVTTGESAFDPKSQTEAIDYYVAKFPENNMRANVELARKNHIKLFQSDNDVEETEDNSNEETNQ
jgi:hypothetical protein